MTSIGNLAHNDDGAEVVTSFSYMVFAKKVIFKIIFFEKRLVQFFEIKFCRYSASPYICENKAVKGKGCKRCSAKSNS